MAQLNCPKCGQSLTLPLPRPEKLTCPACGVGIRVASAKGPAPRQATPPAQESSWLERDAVPAAAKVPVAQGAAGGAKMVAGHELQRELARGGLGIVYLAYHPHFSDFRAIKRPLPQGDFDDAAVLGRFRREVQAMSGLRNNHVISAFDAGEDAEGPYLVLEYLDGESIGNLLARHRRLPVPEACEMIRQAALGLQAAHERGLVHRDIKPSNLILARGHGAAARTVVIDWGLVKRMNESEVPSSRLTTIGMQLGTPDFVAPEQIRDAHGVDVRADIYSLGATLYTMLAGQTPFHERGGADKLLAQTTEPFPPLSQRNDVPGPLMDVLLKMVRKVPGERFQTPAEVAAALQPFCCAEAHRLLALLAPVVGKPAAVQETQDLLRKPTVLAASPPPRRVPVATFAPANTVAPQPKRPEQKWLWPAIGAALAACLIIVVGVMIWQGSGGANTISQHKDKDKDKDNKDKGTDDPIPPIKFGPAAKEQDKLDKLQWLPPAGPILADTSDGKPGVIKKIWRNPWGRSSSAVFYPAGQRAVLRYSYGTQIAGWDLVDFVQRPTNPLSVTGERILPIVVMSPDGRQFLAPSGRTVFRHDGKTFEKQTPIGLFGQCTAVAFSADSKIVATAEQDGDGGRVRFWGSEDLEVARQEIRVNRPVLSLSFSNDGQLLAMSSGGLADMSIVNISAKKIFIYRMEDGKLLRSLDGHEKSASWVGFFADSKRLCSVSPYDGTLRVWNVDDGSEIQKITVSKSLTTVRRMDDETDPNAMLCSFLSESAVGDKRKEIGGAGDLKDPEAMVCLAFWPWGRALVAHLDGSLHLWDLNTGKKVKRIARLSVTDQAQDYATALDISRDGHHALVAYTDGDFFLYRLPPPNIKTAPGEAPPPAPPPPPEDVAPDTGKKKKK